MSLSPSPLEKSKTVFVPVIFSPDQKFPAQLVQDLIAAGDSVSSQRVFVPFIQHEQEFESYLVKLQKREFVTSESYSVLNISQPVSSRKLLQQIITELRSDFESVVLILQLPVVCKYAESQFGQIKCVRQIGEHLQNVKPLEGVENVEKLKELMTKAMGGMEKMFEGVGDVGVVLAFA
ncbi:Hypothetical_protein [Hexamita inflata]|uniref:Hypothetical_protein n=1 Tax=Hexamita inflata TaxID=28002 RepID=A0AA86UL60_9EUKA|nr:Hypothetical protein HINF_LOCUS31428 [Hexamita inflata]